MTKPQFLSDYSDEVTRDCERVLVTLFSGLGPWRDSVFLIGGLRIVLFHDVRDEAEVAFDENVAGFQIACCAALQVHALLLGGQRLRKRAAAGDAQRCEHTAEHQPDCCGKHRLSPPQKAYVRPASPDSGLQIFRDMV